MRMRAGFFVAVLCAGLVAPRAHALEAGDDAQGFERTPPRLALVEGEVSYFRPGAEEWAPARVNTALAAGDELYGAEGANLELQIGPRAFVRAGASTQLGLTSLEPDFLQLRLTTGQLSLDLRSVKASETIEIDTPNAAFTIDKSGYYRVEVDGETTTFTTRRGGGASVTPAQGESAAIAASEQVVVTGADAPKLETYAAPELDAWDRWNYARTDGQLDAVSARYVPAGVYGVDDLDHDGDWRVVPTYGAVWVPRTVAYGWVPYSTGRWVYDPFYGWTWVDDAPWGWAPYHYGRWVFVSNHWGWCPGPIVARPYYSPALVAFYGGGPSVGFFPQVGWVALGWGEPLYPWWGPVRFRHHPHWAGWGGPRVVNEVVVTHPTVVKANEIHIYQNARVKNAIVVVDRDRFGRRGHAEDHFAPAPAQKLEPLRGDLDLAPDRTSLVAATGKTPRPGRDALQRTVVATRAPRPDPTPGLSAPRHAEKKAGAAAATAEVPAAAPPVRVVEPPRHGRHIEVSDRPPFGRQGESERRIAPPAPPFGASQREASGAPEAEPSGASPRERSGAARQPRAQSAPHGARGAAPPESSEAAQPEPVRPAKARPPKRAASEAPLVAPTPPQVVPPQAVPRGAPPLPGEPANRVYRRHGDSPRGEPHGRGPEAGAAPMQPMPPTQSMQAEPPQLRSPAQAQPRDPGAASPRHGGRGASRTPSGWAPRGPTAIEAP